MNWLRSQQNNPSADPEYQAWLKEKKRQEEQAKADERAQKLEKLKPQLPEWNPEWENLLQYDAQGNLVAVPGADPTLPQKYKQYRRARDTAIDNMLRDPYANTLEFIRDDIEQIVQQRVDQALGATTEQQKAEQILQQNSQWLFEYDQSGQPVHDPMTGKPKYSALGRMYSQVAAQYYGSGMSIEQANEHAIRYVESEIARHKYMQDQQAASQQPPAQPGVQPQPGAQPAPAAAPPAPTPNQPPAAQTPQHASFLQRVQNGHMPSQGGTVAAAATPPGTQLPQNPTAGPDLFKQMLTNNFQRHGLLPAT